MIVRTLAGVLLAGAIVWTANAVEPNRTVDAVSAEPVSAARVLFAKPVILRGTLGDAPIQVSLRSKGSIDEGIEGEYFFFGHSQNVLLAGEVEGDDILMEESENGTDVSGQWSGTLAGGKLTGDWESADGKVKKPFTLRVVRPGDRQNGLSSASAATSNQRK